jgi:hypothetical protein
MLSGMKLRLAALSGSAVLAVAGLAAAPASAQPVVTGGLVAVNVSDVDILNNNNVAVLAQIPVGIAANVGACVDADVNVLSVQEIRRGQSFECAIDQQSQVDQMPVGIQRQILRQAGL